MSFHDVIAPPNRKNQKPKTNGLMVQRKCACGHHTVAGGECDQCRKKRLNLQRRGEDARRSADRAVVRREQGVRGSRLDPTALDQRIPHVGFDFSRVAIHNPGLLAGSPAKALTETPEDEDMEKPSPKAGSATIQCDGSGGYEIVYNGWSGAACGTKSCVTAHESSHIADWQAKWPTGCKGQPKGYLPKGDPPDNPLMTVAEYSAFLKQSECKAHTVDLHCAKALPKPAGCEKTVDDYIALTEKQKAEHCPSLSRGAKVAIGAGVGALAGAGIGALAGGPVGAALGAGIGAVVGGIAGAFF